MEKSQRVKLTVLVAFVALLLLNGTGGSEQQIAANMARVRH